jgi:hypothetical protein
VLIPHDMGVIDDVSCLDIELELVLERLFFVSYFLDDFYFTDWLKISFRESVGDLLEQLAPRGNIFIF